MNATMSLGRTPVSPVLKVIHSYTRLLAVLCRTPNEGRGSQELSVRTTRMLLGKYRDGEPYDKRSYAITVVLHGVRISSRCLYKN
jgi:hypothetical protein